MKNIASMSFEDFATLSIPKEKEDLFIKRLKKHTKFYKMFAIGQDDSGVIKIFSNAPIADGSYARRHGQHLYEEKGHGSWLLQIIGDVAAELGCDLIVTCRVSRFSLGRVAVDNGTIKKTFWDDWDQRPGAELPYRRAI